MRRRFHRCVPLLLLFAVAGFLFPASAFPSRFAKKKEYAKALKNWTRGDEQYQRDDFYASIAWNVVYLSPEFLNAQIREAARTYEYSPREEERYRRELMSRFGNHTVFFVSFYAYDHKGSDLAQKDPLWRLRLEVDGERYDPVKIEPVKKPTPFDRQLYPFIKPWARHYYVAFPRMTPLSPGDLRLHVNGPYSHGALSW